MTETTELTGGTRVLRVVGFGVLGLATLPALSTYVGWGSDAVASGAPSPRFAIWLGPVSAYAVAFWFAVPAMTDERLRFRRWPLIGIQAAMTLVTDALMPTLGAPRAQLMLIAAQLGLFLPLWPAIVLVVVQGMLQMWVYSIAHNSAMSNLLWNHTSALLPYSLLIVVTTHLFIRESRIRGELTRTNAELRATQLVVVEQQRMAERLRISRELHDLMGHHLTALNLHLEAASHYTRDKAHDQIERCQTLTKLLLNDVRETVGALRSDQSDDVAKTVRALVEGILQPRIHLRLAEGLVVRDPDCAHTLVRCVQEIITNAVKHSKADNLWIDISKSGERLHVQAHDDGVGTKQIVLGTGLRGMTERLERFGGYLELRSEPSQGFRLDAWVLPAEITS